MGPLLRFLSFVVLGALANAQSRPGFADFGGVAPRNTFRFSTDVLIDMDRDAAPDVVRTTTRGFQIAWNDGDGSFGAFVPYSLPLQVLVGSYYFSAIDVDHDGNPDLVMMPPSDIVMGPLPIVLMRNHGDRRFTLDISVFPLDYRVPSLLAAFPGDFDGDGQEDLVVIGGDTIALLRRVGPLRFEFDSLAFPQVPGPGVDAMRGAVADFDGDGDLDFLLGRGFNLPLEDVVYVSDGTGRFAPGFLFPGQDTHGLDVGDVDGDGDMDVVISSMFGRQPLWLNDGRGNFVNASSRVGTLPQSALWGASGVALRDIDGDSHLDLMFASSTRGVEVWINDGRGRFTDMSSAFGWTVPASGLQVADMDRDGDLDVFFTTLFATPVYKNLTRHVDAPDPVRGSAWPIDIYSRPGWTVSYAVGFGRAALRLPSYGWWGLDPGSTVAFPGTLTVPPSGKVTSTLSVPADTALRGLDIFVQAVEFDVATPNSIRLTNTDGSVIR